MEGSRGRGEPVAVGQWHLPDDLVAWLEEAGRGRLVGATRRPGGGRKEAWFIDIEQADGTVEDLFLRYDPSDPMATHDPWTVQREAVVYRALDGGPVRVPHLVDVHPTRQAMLCDRVAGENRFSAIMDPGDRERIERDFVEQLAALHRIDVAALEMPGFGSTRTITEAVQHELEEWNRILEARGGTVDPALTFTLEWLRCHIPSEGAPIVLVQGDTGPGNFLFREGQVVAIVDWELAHFSDPMDDIAWLTLRCTQDPMGDLPARLKEYEQLSGNPINEERIRYFQVMAEAKLQVMAHRPTSDRAPSGRSDTGNAFIYQILHRRLWLEALGGALGIHMGDLELPSPAEEASHRWMFDAVLTQLRDVVAPAVTDPLSKAYAKGVARMVKYLAQADAYGSSFERDELADLEKLLGESPSGKSVGRQAVSDAVRAGRISDEDYVWYLWRRAARENELARPAMGVLADRHWPSLR